MFFSLTLSREGFKILNYSHRPIEFDTPPWPSQLMNKSNTRLSFGSEVQYLIWFGDGVTLLSETKISSPRWKSLCQSPFFKWFPHPWHLRWPPGRLLWFTPRIYLSSISSIIPFLVVEPSTHHFCGSKVTDIRVLLLTIPGTLSLTLRTSHFWEVHYFHGGSSTTCPFSRLLPFIDEIFHEI